VSRPVLRRITAGQLPALTDAEEWRVPRYEIVSHPPKGYVISFVAFHECGFSVQAERFIHAEYGVQL
jgi:hypothetical protein